MVVIFVLLAFECVLSLLCHHRCCRVDICWNITFWHRHIGVQKQYKMITFKIFFLPFSPSSSRCYFVILNSIWCIVHVILKNSDNLWLANCLRNSLLSSLLVSLICLFQKSLIYFYYIFLCCFFFRNYFPNMNASIGCKKIAAHFQTLIHNCVHSDLWSEQDKKIAFWYFIYTDTWVVVSAPSLEMAYSFIMLL